MARRRYVSTDISLDVRVNRLAAEQGDFAVLLYTWMIPHAADDASLSADPEELLYAVVPGRRDKSADDIQAAIDGMVALGLLQVHGARLRFPPESFYRYQAYVSESRRTFAPLPAQPSSIKEESAQISAEPRESAQDSDESRALAQKSTSSSSSVSVSSSFSHSFSGTRSARKRAAAADALAAEDPPPKIARGPTKKRGLDLAPLVDAFRARGIPDPKLLGTETAAAQALLRHYPPEDIAECWRDFAQGARGGTWERDRLSFGMLSRDNRIGNWQTWRDAGRPREETRNGTHRTNPAPNRPGESAADLAALAKYS